MSFIRRYQRVLENCHTRPRRMPAVFQSMCLPHWRRIFHGAIILVIPITILVMLKALSPLISKTPSVAYYNRLGAVKGAVGGGGLGSIFGERIRYYPLVSPLSPVSMVTSELLYLLGGSRALSKYTQPKALQ